MPDAARPAPAAAAPRVLALAGDIGALIAQIRLLEPLQALQARGAITLDAGSLHAVTPAQLRAAEVVIVQRGSDRRAAWRVAEARHHGAAAICEVDDLLTALPPHVSNAAATAARRPWIERCLRGVDLLTVSTPRLAAELAADVHGLPPWREVPNSCMRGLELPLPQPAHGEPLNLIVASMDGIEGGPLIAALQRLLPGGGCVLHAVGPPGARLRAAGLAVQSHALMPRAEFLRWAHGLPNPLALIPLETSRFAACKSAIKWFDYGAAGVPVVCSDTSPYREVVDPGRTGWLVAPEPAAWLQAVRTLAAEPERRVSMAEAARAQVLRLHGPERMEAAWLAAVDAALALRPGRARPPWPWPERAAIALDRGLAPLRAWNRARLGARR